MTVYVLTIERDGGVFYYDEIVSVHSTQELAEKRREREVESTLDVMKTAPTRRTQMAALYRNEYDIEPYEVDQE